MSVEMKSLPADGNTIVYGEADYLVRLLICFAFGELKIDAEKFSAE